MLKQAGDAVVAAGAAGDRDLHLAEGDVEIVVGGDEGDGRKLVEVEQGAEGAPAVVHESLRLYEQSRATGADIPAGSFGLEAGFVFPLETFGGSQRINHGEAEVVASGGIFAPGVAQSSDQRDGHDSKNSEQNGPPVEAG